MVEVLGPKLTENSRTCTGCKKPTKDHFGPYGKGKCVVAVLEALRTKVEALEKTVVQNEVRHAEELANLSALHEKRLDALLELLETRQADQKVCSENHKPGDSCTAAIDPKDDSEAGKQRESTPITRPLPVHPKPVQDPPTGTCTNVLPCKSANHGSYANVAKNKSVNSRQREECDRPSRPGPPNSASRSSGSTDSEPQQEATPNGLRATRTAPAENSEYAWRLVSGHGRRKLSKPEGNECWEGKELQGTKPAPAKPFHLAGISMECDVRDVVRYCQNRNVLVTGCFLLPSRVSHVSKSAKIFVSSKYEEAILEEGFWPEFMKCRTWEASPPRRRTRAHASTGVHSIQNNNEV